MEQASHALSQTLYANAQTETASGHAGNGNGTAQRPNGQPGETTPEGSDEDAIDAEFEVKA